MFGRKAYQSYTAITPEAKPVVTTFPNFDDSRLSFDLAGLSGQEQATDQAGSDAAMIAELDDIGISIGQDDAAAMATLSAVGVSLKPTCATEKSGAIVSVYAVTQSASSLLHASSLLNTTSSRSSATLAPLSVSDRGLDDDFVSGSTFTRHFPA